MIRIKYTCYIMLYSV